jgi:hypothetical protein
MAILRTLAFAVTLVALAAVSWGNQASPDALRVSAFTQAPPPLALARYLDALVASQSALFSSYSYIGSALGVEKRSEQGAIRRALREKVAEQVAISGRAYSEMSALEPPTGYEGFHALEVEAARLRHEATVDAAADFFDDGEPAPYDPDGKVRRSLALSGAATDLLGDIATP